VFFILSISDYSSLKREDKNPSISIPDSTIYFTFNCAISSPAYATIYVIPFLTLSIAVLISGKERAAIYSFG